MAVKVAINGFGRIGRLAFRQMFGAEAVSYTHLEMKKVKIRLVFNNSRAFCILPAAASLATHRDRASSIPAQDREIPSA